MKNALKKKIVIGLVLGIIIGVVALVLYNKMLFHKFGDLQPELPSYSDSLIARKSFAYSLDSSKEIRIPDTLIVYKVDIKECSVSNLLKDLGFVRSTSLDIKNNLMLPFKTSQFEGKVVFDPQTPYYSITLRKGSYKVLMELLREYYEQRLDGFGVDNIFVDGHPLVYEKLNGRISGVCLEVKKLDESKYKTLKEFSIHDVFQKSISLKSNKGIWGYYIWRSKLLFYKPPAPFEGGLQDLLDKSIPENAKWMHLEDGIIYMLTKKNDSYFLVPVWISTYELSGDVTLYIGTANLEYKAYFFVNILETNKKSK